MFVGRVFLFPWKIETPIQELMREQPKSENLIGTILEICEKAEEMCVEEEGADALQRK